MLNNAAGIGASETLSVRSAMTAATMPPSTTNITISTAITASVILIQLFGYLTVDLAGHGVDDDR